MFKKHKLVWKYIITGASAGCLDLLALYVFKEYFHLWYLSSAVLAFAVSFSLAFVAQKYWTFGDYSDHDIHGQFLWYMFTVILSLGLSIGMLSALVEFARLNYILAQIIALCITGVFGFVMNVRNVFSRARHENGLLIASAIFPPEIGGPASFAHRLARELSSRGAKVSVVTYSSKTGIGALEEWFEVIRVPSNVPAVLRGAGYLILLFVSVVNYRSIFAQDVTSTGLPAMIVKKILPHKKLVLRIGGDLLWERKMESGETELSLVDYYMSGAHRRQFLFKLGKFVMSAADKIIVPADFLRRIYIEYYGVPSSKIVVIKNPIPDINPLRPILEVESPKKEKTVIYAGRFIKLKNVANLISAFLAIYDEIKPARLVLVGEGPERESYLKLIATSPRKESVEIVDTLPRDVLLSRIAVSSLCVCPSSTDVNSNFMLECLASGKPVLSTRNNGLSVKLPEEMLFSYDNREELRRKMKSLLAEAASNDKLAELIASESAKSSWPNIVATYRKIFSI